MDPMVSDVRGFSANPAGLSGMRDWDFLSTTYLNPSEGTGFVFHGFALGKRVFGQEYLALQYSPGSSLRFVAPPRFFGTDSTSGSNDQEISYEESFAAAYAHKITNTLSVGLATRRREETVLDRQYTLIFPDSISLPVGFSDSATTYKTSVWNMDLGVLWQPSDLIRLSAVGRSLFRFRGGGLPAQFDSLSLDDTPYAEGGIAIMPAESFSASLQFSTKGTAALGYEWRPLKSLAISNGLYIGKDQSPTLYAFSARIGWTFDVLDLEASYLRFLKQDLRHGTASLAGFAASSMDPVDLSPFTRNRVSLSARVVFGNVREPLVRILSVSIPGGIYPSSYQVLAYRPIGTVHVKNVSDRPVEAKASFFVDRFMDAPTESKSFYLIPGEEKDIALNAVFNDMVSRVSTGTIRDGNVSISATPADEVDDRAQTRIFIHAKNEWDGDVHSLRYFVRPDDPEVLRYSRDVLLRLRDSLSASPRQLEDMTKARLIFNEFAGKLLYVGDPKQSADFVQYPAETLRLRSGDCDDMTVSFVSLLSSVGISTAFVDVVPPDHPEKSHIYMLFDTGVPPHLGSAISQNPKRYIVRTNATGGETIWIPIETTVITRGFDDAWTSGAQEYFDDVELGLGLAKGWVRIVDVN